MTLTYLWPSWDLGGQTGGNMQSGCRQGWVPARDSDSTCLPYPQPSQILVLTLILTLLSSLRSCAEIQALSTLAQCLRVSPVPPLSLRWLALSRGGRVPAFSTAQAL